MSSYITAILSTSANIFLCNMYKLLSKKRSDNDFCLLSRQFSQHVTNVP